MHLEKEHQTVESITNLLICPTKCRCLMARMTTKKRNSSHEHRLKVHNLRFIHTKNAFVHKSYLPRQKIIIIITLNYCNLSIFVFNPCGQVANQLSILISLKMAEQIEAKSAKRQNIWRFFETKCHFALLASLRPAIFLSKLKLATYWPLFQQWLSSPFRKG